MRILIVGAGAVGGYYGARLIQAGRNVTFLVRPKHIEPMQRDGLRIVSPFHGDTTVKPVLITAQDLTGSYDLILLSVKSPALESAMEDIQPAVGPETVIYPVLNGMNHIDILSQRFGRRSVLGGVTMIVSDMDQIGRIVQFTPIQKLIYGELNGEVTPRLQLVDEALSGAGFDTELSTNIQQAMWDKWVLISSLGLATCLLNGNVGAINSVPDGEATILEALDECAAVATACGHPPPPQLLQNLRKQRSDKESTLVASMYRSLLKGEDVEVETILGDLLRNGLQHQVKTPLLQAAAVRLRIYRKNKGYA